MKFGSLKNPKLHISYVQKYFEPRSEIFAKISSGVQLLVVKISAFKPF